MNFADFGYNNIGGHIVRNHTRGTHHSVVAYRDTGRIVERRQSTPLSYMHRQACDDMALMQVVVVGYNLHISGKHGSRRLL